MTLKNVFGDLALDSTVQEVKTLLGSPSQESTQSEIKTLTDTILVLISAILERQPRVTGNDQMAVSIESGSVGISSSQTLATVTTLGAINTIGGKHASGDNLNLAGVQHIYNNIVVT